MSDEEEPISNDVAKSDREIELEEIAERQNELIRNLTNQIKNKNGSPKYDEAFIPILLRHMGLEGKSYQSLAFKLGVSAVKTLYNWEKRWPEWKAAKDIASMGRLSFIEDMLEGLATGKNKGNAAAAIFYAKNAAPDEFKDKREIDIQGSVTYVLDTGIPARQLPDQLTEQIVEDVEYSEVKEEDFGDLL